jgi:hypothetical protein
VSGINIAKPLELSLGFFMFVEESKRGLIMEDFIYGIGDEMRLSLHGDIVIVDRRHCTEASGNITKVYVCTTDRDMVMEDRKEEFILAESYIENRVVKIKL